LDNPTTKQIPQVHHRHTTTKSHHEVHLFIQLRQTMPNEHAAMAPPALQLSSDLSNPSRKRLKMNPAAPAPRSAASILARSFGSVPDAKLMKPLNYTGNAGQILVRMMQRKNQWIIQSQAWDVSRERSAYRNVIDSLVSRIFRLSNFDL
jgi:hypothetical protein